MTHRPSTAARLSAPALSALAFLLTLALGARIIESPAHALVPTTGGHTICDPDEVWVHPSTDARIRLAINLTRDDYNSTGRLCVTKMSIYAQYPGTRIYIYVMNQPPATQPTLKNVAGRAQAYASADCVVVLWDKRCWDDTSSKSTGNCNTTDKRVKVGQIFIYKNNHEALLRHHLPRWPYASLHADQALLTHEMGHVLGLVHPAILHDPLFGSWYCNPDAPTQCQSVMVTAADDQYQQPTYGCCDPDCWTPMLSVSDRSDLASLYPTPVNCGF